MGLMDCLHIAAPMIIGAGAAFTGPLGFSVYKYGVKATAGYIIGLPSRFAGYIMTAYASKLTKIFAVATALGSTIHAATKAVSSGQGLTNVANVFLGEVYRETLSATGLIAQGFQELTMFLNQGGICSTLVNLDLIGAGIFHLWRGIAIVIVVLSLWGYYRSRGRKTQVDFDEKIILITALFSVTTVVNMVTGDASSSGLISMIQNAVEFFQTLSDTINNAPVNNTVNNTS